MQKGTMIAGIVDGVTNVMAVAGRVAKKAKEDGLFTEKENAYINGVFNDWQKEGNQFIEKVKELISPKLSMTEEDKIKLFMQMYEVIKKYATAARRFEKGFANLSEERRKKLTDVEEVQRLFKIKNEGKET